jgi:hypothetical protein
LMAANSVERYPYLPNVTCDDLRTAAARLRGGEREEVAPPAHNDVGVEHYRHKVRGTTYEIVGVAELQDAGGQGRCEGAQLVIYRGPNGIMWAREKSEFHDGRFEKIAALRAESRS